MNETSQEDRAFFDVAIHRCTPEVHAKEMEKQKAEFVEKSNDDKDYAASIFDEDKWYQWRYNEIIAWVRIYAGEKQLRGELYYVEWRAIHGGKGGGRRIFKYRQEAFKLPFNNPSTLPKTIFDKLIGALENVTKEDPCKDKGRYIDLETLRNLEDVVDWKKLVKL